MSYFCLPSRRTFPFTAPVRLVDKRPFSIVPVFTDKEELLTQAQSCRARLYHGCATCNPAALFIRSVFLGSATVRGMVDRKVILSKGLVLQRGIHAGTKKKTECKCKRQYIHLEDGKAGTGPLTRGDAVFSEQIASMKDLDGFI